MSSTGPQSDRSESWRKSKRAGHALELELGNKLRTDLVLANSVSARVFGRPQGLAIEVNGGGTSEGKVSDVFGKSTNGKTDIYSKWSSGLSANFSLKMSPESQAFLTTVDRFCDGFEICFKKKIPQEVKKILHLFIGDNEEFVRENSDGVQLLGPMHAKSKSKLEVHQHRFVGKTLEKHFEDETAIALQWFKDHVSEITRMVFVSGYSVDSKNHSSHLWYYFSSKKFGKVDFIIPMKTVVEISEANIDCIGFRKNSGGSVLELPFGKLQMHRPSGNSQMQFRHDLRKLNYK